MHSAACRMRVLAGTGREETRPEDRPIASRRGVTGCLPARHSHGGRAEDLAPGSWARGGTVSGGTTVLPGGSIRGSWPIGLSPPHGLYDYLPATWGKQLRMCSIPLRAVFSRMQVRAAPCPCVA